MLNKFASLSRGHLFVCIRLPGFAFAFVLMERIGQKVQRKTREESERGLKRRRARREQREARGSCTRREQCKRGAKRSQGVARWRGIVFESRAEGRGVRVFDGHVAGGGSDRDSWMRRGRQTRGVFRGCVDRRQYKRWQTQIQSTT